MHKRKQSGQATTEQSRNPEGITRQLVLRRERSNTRSTERRKQVCQELCFKSATETTRCKRYVLGSTQGGGREGRGRIKGRGGGPKGEGAKQSDVEDNGMLSS